MEKIKAIIDYYSQKVTGRLGVGFKNFKTGEEYYVRGDERFPSASVFKVPVLVTLFDLVEKGKISLDDKITLTEDKIAPGSGVLSVLKPGLTMHVRDYATLMMIVSDNTGTDITHDLVGKANIQAMIEKLGLKNTKSDLKCKHLIFGLMGIPLDMKLSDAAKIFESGDYKKDDTLRYNFDVENDISSPKDMVKIFSLIRNKEIVSPKACEEMMEIMESCQTNSRLPYHLPSSHENPIAVIHKTGTLEDVANDCGIVKSPTQEYALCMFYDGYKASEQEKEEPHHHDYLLAGLSKEIYDALHG